MNDNYGSEMNNTQSALTQTAEGMWLTTSVGRKNFGSTFTCTTPVSLQRPISLSSLPSHLEKTKTQQEGRLSHSCWEFQLFPLDLICSCAVCFFNVSLRRNMLLVSFLYFWKHYKVTHFQQHVFWDARRPKFLLTTNELWWFWSVVRVWCLHQVTPCMWHFPVFKWWITIISDILIRLQDISEKEFITQWESWNWFLHTVCKSQLFIWGIMKSLFMVMMTHILSGFRLETIRPGFNEMWLLGLVQTQCRQKE